jgi:hypothetical protein
VHESVRLYVARQVKRYGLAGKSVLEIGSLDVNGSVRDQFTGHYWGIDVTAGPGVDQVRNAHELGQYSGPYDVVLCLEMLEHDTAPWRTAEGIAACLDDGGIAIVTARGYVGRHAFPEHMVPHDYWRFSVDGMRHLLTWAGLDVVECVPDPEAPGVLATARAK